MLPNVTSARLRDQLANFEILFLRSSQQAWNRKPKSGKWSARENLAHLGRYHEIFLDRLHQILKEDQPRFARYRAEEDEQWSSWTSLSTQVVQDRIRERRAELMQLFAELTPAQLERTGSHPVLGEMRIGQWLEFFLLHEAHHLYAVLFRLREPA